MQMSYCGGDQDDDDNDERILRQLLFLTPNLTECTN